MKLILDTNALIDPPDDSFAEAHRYDTPLTAAFCYAELFEGEFATDASAWAGAAAQAADARTSYGPGLPFDDSAALAYRSVCQAVVGRGRRLTRARPIDLMVAAVALANGCALVTRGRGNFAGLEGLVEVIELEPGLP
ncbi:MAG: hypothetical protein LBK95_08140 [Bifidobacteriaceae bacterium]|jgi:predicted nucleic acid-binding protein|nr:hypothetical protein [Bifidobacteriaceae bacterium]